MLFILTGDVQTGKTRWLMALIEKLGNAGVTCYGVVAPGVWESHCEGGEARYEKLGIDNVLLPQKELVRFALRKDIAASASVYDGDSQSAVAQLDWAISDAAIREVNDHFLGLAAQAEEAAEAGSETPGLLVADEFGRLELERGQGLDEAVALVEAGPNALYAHALIVVREGLYDVAYERFAPAWPQMRKIYPTRESEESVLKELTCPRQ